MFKSTDSELFSTQQQYKSEKVHGFFYFYNSESVKKNICYQASKIYYHNMAENCHQPQVLVKKICFLRITFLEAQFQTVIFYKDHLIVTAHRSLTFLRKISKILQMNTC